MTHPTITTNIRKLQTSWFRLERMLLAAFGSTLFILVAAAASFGALASVHESKRWVVHTHDVIAALDDLGVTMLEAETGQRGYLFTSDPAYLSPYRRAEQHVTPALVRLRDLTADDPEQQARLRAVEQAVHDRLAVIDETIQLHDAADEQGAIALLRSGKGKRLMDEARRVLGEMRTTEEGLLHAREMQQERSLTLTAGVIGGGSLFAFVLGVLVNFGIRRDVLERRSIQEVMVEQSSQLAAQTRTLVESQRALARQLEEHRALTEHLRRTNQTLDEHVQSLTATKADLLRALAERGRAITGLEKANQDLDNFAYAASHDLKAPLRGIASLSDWLEEDLGPAMTDKARDQIRMMHGRVHRMEALIDGILAYARASRAKDKTEAIEIAAFLREVVELLSPPRGVVTIELPDSMPRLEVQKVPFQQVWMNLVGNALKHAACEEARIRISAQPEGDALRFSVSDNGPGIAKRFHERIFRIFHTLASRDKVEGAGIGLAIVKKLVDDRGGRVWVESEEGKGATFHFTWPMS